MLDLFSRQKKRFEIDMAPLIDVVFLLLIFFMLTFAIQGQGLSISLPEGEKKQEVEKNIVIKIEIRSIEFKYSLIFTWCLK